MIVAVIVWGPRVGPGIEGDDSTKDTRIDSIDLFFLTFFGRFKRLQIAAASVRSSGSACDLLLPTTQTRA